MRNEKNNMILFLLLVIIAFIAVPFDCVPLATPSQISSSPVENNQRGLLRKTRNVDGDEYDDYPYKAIAAKKSAPVLNKLMYALRDHFYQVDRDSAGKMHGNGDRVEILEDPREEGGIILRNLMPLYGNLEGVNLQRRGQKDRKNFRICYFNAVSCFS